MLPSIQKKYLTLLMDRAIINRKITMARRCNQRSRIKVKAIYNNCNKVCNSNQAFKKSNCPSRSYFWGNKKMRESSLSLAIANIQKRKDLQRSQILKLRLLLMSHLKLLKKPKQIMEYHSLDQTSKHRLTIDFQSPILQSIALIIKYQPKLPEIKSTSIKRFKTILLSMRRLVS